MDGPKDRIFTKVELQWSVLVTSIGILFALGCSSNQTSKQATNRAAKDTREERRYEATEQESTEPSTYKRGGFIVLLAGEGAKFPIRIPIPKYFGNVAAEILTMTYFKVKDGRFIAVSSDSPSKYPNDDAQKGVRLNKTVRGQSSKSHCFFGYVINSTDPSTGKSPWTSSGLDVSDRQMRLGVNYDGKALKPFIRDWYHDIAHNYKVVPI